MLAFVSRRCCRVFAECQQQQQIVASPLLSIFRNVHDAAKYRGRIKESGGTPSNMDPRSILPSAGNTSKETCHPHPIESDGNSTTKAARPLSYYSNLGIRQRKVNQLIRRSRESKGVHVSADVKRMRGFLDTLKEYNFTEEDVSKLIMKKPRIFDVSTKTLKKRIDTLIRHGFLETDFKKVITRDPNLLVYDEKKASVAARLKILQELDVLPKLDRDTAFYLVQKCPKLLSVTDVSVLNSRIYNLFSYGLNEKQMYKLVMRQPSLLLQKESTLNPKIDYITNMLGAPSGLMVKCPRALTQSLRRIKGRHLYLVKENLFKTGSDRRLTENQLRALVLTSDEAFVTHVTRTNMEDFREFQQQILEEQNTREERKKAVDSDLVRRKESIALEERDDSYETEEGDEDFLDYDGDKDFLDYDGDEDFADYDADEELPDYDDEVDEDFVDYDDYNLEDDGLDNDYDVQEKRRYLNSFGSSSRQKGITDEEWYNMPFPEIQPPEEGNVADADTKHRFKSKRKRKTFHKSSRR